MYVHQLVWWTATFVDPGEMLSLGVEIVRQDPHRVAVCHFLQQTNFSHIFLRFVGLRS